MAKNETEEQKVERIRKQREAKDAADKLKAAAKKEAEARKPVDPAAAKAKKEADAAAAAAEKAAAKAKKDAEAAAKKAEAEKTKADKKKADAKAKADKKKADAKAKADAAKEAAKAEKEALKALDGQLSPLAKEINVRIAKAEKLEKDADDHRLAAALQFVEAKKIFETEAAKGLSFKKWSEEHIKGWSYETIRKLVAVGQSPDPALALADMRGKNAEANKEKRERDKAEKKATKEATGGGSGEGGGESEADEEKEILANAELAPLAYLKLRFEKLEPKEQAEFVHWAGEFLGFAVSVKAK